MTLPVSPNAISLSQVNTELGLSATATISMNDTAVRTLFGRAGSGTTISMSDGHGKANEFAFTISSNQTSANLRTLAINAGWNQTVKVLATIGSGVYVSSSLTGAPALTISGSFPEGVVLTNNGFIVGMGGAGGNGRRAEGSPDGFAGGTGGLALSVLTSVSITNNGTIGGGGGGGGGGGAGSFFEKAVAYGNGGGGGGGGRTGATNSPGGSGGANVIDNQDTNAHANPAFGGSAGTSSGAGAGGGGGSNPVNPSDPYNGAQGGAGGGWGAAGSAGGTANSDRNDGTIWGSRRFGLAGGSAGAAVSGNSNITWLATGTRLGAIT